MSTLQQIKDIMGRSVNYQVKEISTGLLRKVSLFVGDDVEFSDGALLPLITDGFVIVSIPTSGIMAVNQQKDACRFIMDEFQGENRDLISDGTLTIAHLQEMLNDEDLVKIERFSGLGLADFMMAVWSVKPINTTWFTQARKDLYAAKLQVIIDTLG